MAGMEGLGRVFNIVGTASGVAINMSACSGVTFYGTNDGTYSLTASKTFGSGYTATPVASWAPIHNVYYNTDNGAGTGKWVKDTVVNAAAYTQSSDYAIAFTIFGSEFPDGYTWVKCTKTTDNDGNPSCMALLHDLTVQRTPANLPAVSA